MNRAQLLGHVGSAPEVRYTGAGMAVGNFRMATNERWKDKAGEEQERTEWHSVVVWGKLAELVGENVPKGCEVFVEGRIQTREWTDKENIKRYTVEIVAENLRWFGKRERAGAAPAPTDAHAPPAGRKQGDAPEFRGGMGPARGEPSPESFGPPPAGPSGEDIPF